MRDFTLMVKALRRHKGATALIVFQVATVLAVVVNCAFQMHYAFETATRPLGFDEEGLVLVQSIAVAGADGKGSAVRNMISLRNMPGVVDASLGIFPLGGVPTGNVSDSRDLSTKLTATRIFEGAQGYMNTLGAALIEGQPLTDDILPDANDIQAEQPTVISHALALKLFGDNGAVGRLIFDGRRTYRVMGVTREIVASLPSAASDRYSMIIATRFPDVDIGGMYLVRAEAGQSDRVLESAKKTLRDLNPTHVQPMAKTFAQFKRERVAKTSALAYMLGFLVIGLVGIALFGIASLTSLWVRQRRTSIGIRRALGATSGQILGYFLVENAVLMAVSGLLGVGLAIAINLMAAAYLSLPSISLPMCLMSFAGMVVLGQAAAFGPALRAARTPPASAIRNL